MKQQTHFVLLEFQNLISIDLLSFILYSQYIKPVYIHMSILGYGKVFLQFTVKQLQKLVM